MRDFFFALLVSSEDGIDASGVWIIEGGRPDDVDAKFIFHGDGIPEEADEQDNCSSS